MANVYLQLVGEYVPLPAPEDGEIVQDYYAWHAPGQFVPFQVHYYFNDTSNTKKTKLRAAAVSALALESVIVSGGDKVIIGCALEQI